MERTVKVGPTVHSSGLFVGLGRGSLRNQHPTDTGNLAVQHPEGERGTQFEAFGV